MTLNLPEKIDEKDSKLLLSQQMMQAGKSVLLEEEQVQFIMREMNKPCFEHAPQEAQSHTWTKQEATEWLNKQRTLHQDGQKVLYFAYNRETQECVGIISAQLQYDTSVEIRQIASADNYTAQCEMLRLLEQGLMNDTHIQKFTVKINVDSIDTTRPFHLRQQGYHIESVSHDRILNLGKTDYVTYAKQNPSSDTEEKLMDTPQKICRAMNRKAVMCAMRFNQERIHIREN